MFIKSVYHQCGFGVKMIVRTFHPKALSNSIPPGSVNRAESDDIYRKALLRPFYTRKTSSCNVNDVFEVLLSHRTLHKMRWHNVFAS